MRGTFALIAIAWLCGIAGILWAYLLAFASAMKTVPAMAVGYFLMTLPLPALCLWAAVTVLRRIRANNVSRGYMWGVVPALIFGAVGLFIGFAAYFDMT